MPPVLFVVFQIDNRADGGVESVTQIIERAPGRRIVLSQRDNAFAERWRRAGCDVHVLPVEDGTPSEPLQLWLSRLRRSPRAAAFNLKAFELVRSNGVRVVHCNDIAAFWHAAVGARLAGARVLFNVRDTLADGRTYDLRWRAARSLSAEVVCLSAEMVRTFQERCPPLRFLPDARVTHTYSAIDLDRMRPDDAAERERLRGELGLEREAFHVVLVGVVHDKKNQLGFLEHAMPELARRLPGVRVTLVGDYHPDRDGYARSCRDAAELPGVRGKIRFTGFVTDTERYYRAADVVCVVSRYEGLPRCMIESLACGTPVVSFDVASTREVLEANDVGMVVPKYDYAALVAALVRLAGAADARASMAKRARVVATACFDPSKSVGAYVARYANWASV